jgi:CHAD domain-containing protein
VGRVLADKHAASAEPERKTAAALVRGYLAEHIEAFVAADLALRASNAGVHDLRVESRRLRTILAVYRNLFDESRARNLQHELKWIGQILGQLRDIEVTFERLEQALDDDPTAGPGPSTITPARRLLSTEQRIAKTAVQRSLASERYASLIDAIYDFVSDPPWTGRARKSAKKSLPKFSGKPRKRLRKRANKLSDPDHGVAERHEVRKAARRLRYSVEVLRPIDKRADKLRKRSKDLQSALGDYLDDRGLGAVLWRLRLEPVPARRAFVYGRLHARTETMTATHLERAHDELGKTLETAANYP